MDVCVPGNVGRKDKDGDKTTTGNGQPLLLKPNRFGFRDRIDLWYEGYAVSITNKYPKAKHVQRIMKYIFKVIYLVSGVVILPTLSLAIRKNEQLSLK